MNPLRNLAVQRPMCLALAAAGGMHVTLTLAGLPGWPCPFRAATGLPCPGCGLGRACALLIVGDMRAALAMHAFAPLALAGIGAIAAAGLLPKRYIATCATLLERLDRKNRLTQVILAALLVYWIVRLFLDAHA